MIGLTYTCAGICTDVQLFGVPAPAEKLVKPENATEPDPTIEAESGCIALLLCTLSANGWVRAAAGWVAACAQEVEWAPTTACVPAWSSSLSVALLRQFETGCRLTRPLSASASAGLPQAAHAAMRRAGAADGPTQAGWPLSRLLTALYIISGDQQASTAPLLAPRSKVALVLTSGLASKPSSQEG